MNIEDSMTQSIDQQKYSKQSNDKEALRDIIKACTESIRFDELEMEDMIRDEDGAAIAYDKLQLLYKEFIEQFEKQQRKADESASSAMQKFFEEQFQKSQKILQTKPSKSQPKTHTIFDIM